MSVVFMWDIAVMMIVDCGSFDIVKQRCAIALKLYDVGHMTADESAGVFGHNVDALAYVASGIFKLLREFEREL